MHALYEATAQPAAGLRLPDLGYLCMICCALLPDRLIPVPKGHELLAIAAFLCICIGTDRLAWRARAVPVLLSFAFWQWTSSAVLSVYTALLCAAGPGGPQATR